MLNKLVLLLLLLSPALCWAGDEAPAWPIKAWPLVSHNAQGTDVLWPVFHARHHGSYKRFAIRPFIFNRETDPAQQMSKTSAAFSLISFKYWEDHSALRVAPIYWQGEGNRDGGASYYRYFHLWPLYGTNQRGDYREQGVIWPLFRYGHDPEFERVRWDAPWPLIGYRRNGEYISHRALPLYWRGHGPDRSGGFVFPYFWRQTPEGSERGVFPLWYRARGESRNTDLLFPLYFRHQTPERQIRMITPLYYDATTGERRRQILFPLWYADKAPQRETQVAPFYLHLRREHRRFTVAFPLYFSRRDTQKQTAFTAFFPLYGSTTQGDTVTRRFFALNLYGTHHDPDTGAHGWDVLWPLIHHDRSPDASSTRVLPLYWQRDTPEFSFKLSLPYSSYRGADGESKRYFLGPLWVDTRNPAENLRKQSALYPLFLNEHKGERHRNWLMPFYYHHSDPASRLTMALFPPYFHLRNDTATIRHWWPFYGQSQVGDYTEKSVLWPLFRVGRHRDSDDSLTQILLYQKRHKGDSDTTQIWPLWQHKVTPQRTLDASLLLHWIESDRAEQKTQAAFLWLLPPKLALIRYQTGPQQIRHSFFPLYSYQRNDAEQFKKWTVLWPLMSHKTQGDSKEFRFLWRLIYRRTTPNVSEFELNPLFAYERKNGQLMWQVLGGLFGRRVGEDGTPDNQFLWVF